MDNETLTRTQSDELFFALKKIIVSAPTEQELLIPRASGVVNSPETAKTGLDICMKVASVIDSEDEFASFIFDNNIPPIKLTDKEMNLLRGGAIPFVAMAIYAIADTVVEARTGESILYHASRAGLKAARRMTR